MIESDRIRKSKVRAHLRTHIENAVLIHLYEGDGVRRRSYLTGLDSPIEKARVSVDIESIKSRFAREYRYRRIWKQWLGFTSKRRE